MDNPRGCHNRQRRDNFFVVLEWLLLLRRGRRCCYYCDAREEEVVCGDSTSSLYTRLQCTTFEAALDAAHEFQSKSRGQLLDRAFRQMLTISLTTDCRAVDIVQSSHCFANTGKIGTQCVMHALKVDNAKRKHALLTQITTQCRRRRPKQPSSSHHQLHTYISHRFTATRLITLCLNITSSSHEVVVTWPQVAATEDGTLSS
eukprot:scaffold8384_cov161-Ochromonas_danica.AAC.3